MTDDRAALAQRILVSFGEVQIGGRGFGQQMSAISSAVGTHIAKAILKMGSAEPDAAALEAAELMRRQIVEIAQTQIAFALLGKGNPQ